VLDNSNINNKLSEISGEGSGGRRALRELIVPLDGLHTSNNPPEHVERLLSFDFKSLN
jgi:hypothetical protein